MPRMVWYAHRYLHTYIWVCIAAEMMKKVCALQAVDLQLMKKKT